jgi:hypothetical protein
MQYSALGYLFILYAFQGLKYVLYDSKKKVEKQEERTRLKSINDLGSKSPIAAATRYSNENIDEGGYPSSVPS